MKRIRIRACAALGLLLLTLAGLFTACGDERAPDIDPAAICTELLGSGAFSEGLEPLDTDIALTLYGLTEDSCASSIFYLSTGATAEELAILQVADGGSMQTLQDAVQYRLTYQKDSFENYVPAEIPKLDGAIVRTQGDYLIFCVAADGGAAGAIIDKYFG